MKRGIHTAALLCLLSLPCFGQEDKLIDERDNRSYSIGLVNDRWWMLENLGLETDRSFELTATQKEQYPDVEGRWYHMEEIDAVCPAGWGLPSAEDWLGYLGLLMQEKGGLLVTRIRRSDINIINPSRYIDLFNPDNPLRIRPAGIYQGTEFIYAPESADYWIRDIPTRNEVQGTELKAVKYTYPGTSHIHLFNANSNIHSHDHHLDPDEEHELRRFLVRCIKNL